jgi:ABC-type glycerol-3-phosphate transport system substrate-binding protein
VDELAFQFIFGGVLVDSMQQPVSPRLNQPANVQAMHWYASLFSEHKLTQPLEQASQIYTLVGSGSCAMWIDVLSRGIYGSTGNFEAAPLPLPVYEDPIALLDLDGYYILAGTAHPQEAWLWTRFLMEHALASGKLIPPLRSLAASEEYALSVSADTRDIANNLPQNLMFIGLDMRQNKRLQAAAMQHHLALQRVLKGETDAQTALDQAQQEALQAFSP